MPLAACAQAADLPIRTLRATAGHDAEKSTAGEAYADTTEVIAALKLQLREADPAHRGQVLLEFSADTGPGQRASRITVRVPLASADAGAATPAMQPGTSCTVSPEGRRTLVYTDHLDPKQSVPFQPAPSLTGVELSLNQSLCHALAAEYLCNGVPTRPPQSWAAWHLARTARLILRSDVPSTLELSPVAIIATDRSFSPAQCRSAGITNAQP